MLTIYFYLPFTYLHTDILMLYQRIDALLADSYIAFFISHLINTKQYFIKNQFDLPGNFWSIYVTRSTS